MMVILRLIKSVGQTAPPPLPFSLVVVPLSPAPSCLPFCAKKPWRKKSDIQRPGRYFLHQARSVVRRSTSGMKSERVRTVRVMDLHDIVGDSFNVLRRGRRGTLNIYQRGRRVLKNEAWLAPPRSPSVGRGAYILTKKKWQWIGGRTLTTTAVVQMGGRGGLSIYVAAAHRSLYLTLISRTLYPCRGCSLNLGKLKSICTASAVRVGSVRFWCISSLGSNRIRAMRFQRHTPNSAFGQWIPEYAEVSKVKLTHTRPKTRKQNWDWLIRDQKTENRTGMHSFFMSQIRISSVCCLFLSCGVLCEYARVSFELGGDIGGRSYRHISICRTQQYK